MILGARSWVFVALATGLGSGCRWNYDPLDDLGGGAGSSAQAGASGSGTGGIAVAGGGGAVTGGANVGGGTAGTSAGSGGLAGAGGLAGGGAGGTPAIGGMDFGGASASGGTGTGGADTGGTATGGVGTGGVAAGGVATGGTETGGFETGGVPTGGVPTGGLLTGGVPTGGVATGGVPTGGTATGGVATGGVPTGGAATGGIGGSPGVCVPDESCTCSTYMGHDYRFCPVEMWWDNALADCQNVGMSLVKVDDGSENAWLTTEAQARGLFPGRAPLVFLGGTQRAVPGEWRWLDGTLFWNGGEVPGVYNNFAGPPDVGGLSECLGLQTDGTWVDRTCNSRNVAYVCESL